MLLNLVTPEKLVFEGEITSVQLPGTDGSFEILNSQAALISSLGKGNVKITTTNGVENYMIDGGVAEVLDNIVIVLAESLIEE